MKKKFIKNLLSLLTLIILYYIVLPKNIFIYAFSYTLYNLFVSCYSHIDIKNAINKYDETYHKRSILNYLILIYSVLTLLFILISILASDIIGTILKIDNITVAFIIMSIATITKPLVSAISEYLMAITKNKKYSLLNEIYFAIDNILLLFIALLVFNLLDISNGIANALLYLSKIASALVVLIPIIIINRSLFSSKDKKTITKVNYQKEVKKVLTNNSYKSTINIVKNSYYYISIIIVYYILSTRYNYQSSTIEKNITFIYFYGISIMNFLICLTKIIDEKIPKMSSLTNRLYNNFKIMLTIAIILSIVSPLTCKILFNNPKYGIYQTMINFLAIFMLLYEVTYESIKNKRLIYLGLVISLITKIALEIPFINAFYRMGYNLIYGDILSTIIAVLISIIINYVYIKNTDSVKEKYFEKILNILYENIILCIILVLMEFIVPINTDSYLKSIGIMIIYLAISILYLFLKNKKRG